MNQVIKRTAEWFVDPENGTIVLKSLNNNGFALFEKDFLVTKKRGKGLYLPFNTNRLLYTARHKKRTTRLRKIKTEEKEKAEGQRLWIAIGR